MSDETRPAAETLEQFRIISELVADYAFSCGVTLDGALPIEWATDSLARVTGYTKDEINRRLDAVEAGVKEFVAREELRRALEGVLDIERLLSRVTLETANPRDVLALCASLNRIPRIKVALARLAAKRLAELNGLLDEMTDLRERIRTRSGNLVGPFAADRPSQVSLGFH